MSQSDGPSGSERVLRRERPSVRPRFVQPVVLKQAALFLLCTDTGDVLADSDQGLYFHDMRYLSGLSLTLSGASPVSLLASANQGHEGVFELTNPDLHDPSGRVAVRKETLGIRREKSLGNQYRETIIVSNFVPDPCRLDLQLHFEADFADMFAVRGVHPGKRGEHQRPRWDGNRLLLAYEGADGHDRRLSLTPDPAPDEHNGGDLAYHLELKGREQWRLTLDCHLEDRKGGPLESKPRSAEGAGHHDRARARTGALGHGTRVQSDNPLFNDILARSFLDLQMLRMQQKGQAFFAAGVPWYVALFGRDSLVTALEVAAFDPGIIAHTLRVLASHQGTKVDDWRDEQPGKILHELRVDEMANLDEIPQTPYYGSVDSTPLFLVLLGEHAKWVGSLDLFHELRDNVERALRWIDEYGDSDDDGFVDYRTHSSRGGRNQGWKDSGNGIVMEDGTLAEPPIALPEVQGDVYRAWLSVAELCQRDGETSKAQALRDRAARLREAFDSAFWLEDAKYYAFCRRADGRFSKSVASNPAHALWTGVVDPRRAPHVARRVLRPDMFSGWGVRTLSSDDASYNPVDYQVGSVWPHDNAFVMVGMHRAGLTAEAERVFEAILDAAAKFDHYRLPEVFAGYDRQTADRPVKYPVACSPQAWAAGSVPFMLTAALGLEPAAFDRRLRIRHPHLPSWLRWLNVRGLHVGDAQLDLRYERTGHRTEVSVVQKTGDVDVTVED